MAEKGEEPRGRFKKCSHRTTIQVLLNVNAFWLSDPRIHLATESTKAKASMTKKMAEKVSFGKSFKNCIQDYECLLETALVIFRIIDIFTDLVGALLSDD